jgi:hypothetical protein
MLVDLNSGRGESFDACTMRHDRIPLTNITSVNVACGSRADPGVMIKASVPFVAALLSAACLVGSLHPVYDDETIVFDEMLIGNWANSESEVTVLVERGEWRSYHLAYTDRFGTTRFTGHLARVGPARFLNVRPEDGLERPAFLVVTNGMLQIEIEPARIRVREPEYGAVLARLNANKLTLEAATDLKQNVVITAPTPTLRAWLLKALEDEDVWADWKTFTRSTR